MLWGMDNEYDIEVCIDCLMLLANGEISEESDHSAEEHAALMDRGWPSDEWELAIACPEDCEGSFSWRDCQGCGSRLGGDRHPVAVFRNS